MGTTAATPVTERKRYLDAAKGWGITMVVFGHITALGNPVDTYFSAYKLVIFYIVSGYLMCMRQSFRRLGFKDFLKKQAEGLLIPYFGYSVIVMLYNIGLGFMKGNAWEKIFHKFLEQLYTTFSLRGISALWFLPSLFIAQVLFYLVIKAPFRVKVLSGIVPLFTTWYAARLLPMLEDNLDTVPYKIASFPILTVSKGILAFWFVGAGYISFLFLRKIKNRGSRFLLGVVLTGAVIWLSRYNRGVDINLCGIGERPYLLYINGVAASIGAILVLEFLEKWWKMRYLSFCGRHSLIIMATHGTLGFKALLIRGWRSFYTLSETPGLRYYLECSGILMELMLLECGVIKVVETYLPWLTGKKGKK